MSVYLKDDMVLLNSDLVAVDTACCCGGAHCCHCANSFDPILCTDGDGNFWSGQSCDGSCSGIMIPADSGWTACMLNYTCCGGECSGTGGLEYIDPDTCEFAGAPNSRGGCVPIFPGANCNTIVSAEGICKTGACCVGTDCFPDTLLFDCLSFEGVYQGDGTDCDPNPCV